MPKEIEGLDDPKTYIEYRGIRGGEKGSKAPVKTPPRVRMPMKNPGNESFDVDEKLMEAIAIRMGYKKEEWHTKVDSIPVFVFSDEIVGDGGIVYLERALYARRGRLCGSAAGDENAKQLVNLKAYAQNKQIKMLPESKTVTCNEDCPLWGTPEKPTDCKWRAVVNVQLQDDQVFPSPVRHRTTSKNSIRSMVTSLKAIASVTGGVLAGIPLFFRQAKIDVKDREGKNRRIPIMVFEYRGTKAELRAAAIRELASRKALEDARGGKFDGTKLHSMATTVLDEGLLHDDPVEDRTEDDEAEREASVLVNDESQELMSQIAVLFKKLGYTPANRRALETKHQGNLKALLNELKAEAPADFDPAPGEPGDESEEDQDPPEHQESSVSDDEESLEGLFD